jgi:predicted nuclease with TOPRIM domain
MNYADINEAKARVESLKAEAARIEKEIRRAELNAEMNTIEAKMIKNNMLISTLLSKFPEDDAVGKVVEKIEKENSTLNTQWNKAYDIYFNL